MAGIRVNQDVVTPNGPGVMIGTMVEDGVPLIAVRHQICKMTSQDAGRNLFPRAQVSGIWQYPPEQVKA